MSGRGKAARFIDVPVPGSLAAIAACAACAAFVLGTAGCADIWGFGELTGGVDGGDNLDSGASVRGGGGHGGDHGQDGEIGGPGGSGAGGAPTTDGAGGSTTIPGAGGATGHADAGDARADGADARDSSAGGGVTGKGGAAGAVGAGGARAAGGTSGSGGARGALGGAGGTIGAGGRMGAGGAAGATTNVGTGGAAGTGAGGTAGRPGAGGTGGTTACVSGSTRCLAGGNLQTCSSAGIWQSSGTSTHQLLVNPGFDLGTNGWTISVAGGFPLIYVGNGMGGTNMPAVVAQSPPNVAWFGGYANADDVGAQSVAVPADATGINLSFFVAVTSRGNGNAENDVMDVTVTAGAQTTTVAHFSNLTPSANFMRVSATLPAALAGQTVRLQFRDTTDANGTTSFYVDTVAMQVNACP